MILICAILFTTGCASVITRESHIIKETYPSAKVAGEFVKKPSVYTPFVLLDLPFSLAWDTVNLPFDAVAAAKAKERREERNNQRDVEQEE